MAIDLSNYTMARVGLATRGSSLSTSELLKFDLDHARARDAVWMEMDPSSLGFDHVLVHSLAKDRRTYLLRPDLGRRLEEKLEKKDCGVALVVADGLSALAVHRHAAEMVRRLSSSLQVGSVVVASQARVAIGDDIGYQLGAEVVVLLIGERPGLTSPDSLGAYITYGPRPGRTDAERNCVSNIRPEGLSYDGAAALIQFLTEESRLRKVSGVSLKGDVDSHFVGGSS